MRRMRVLLICPVLHDYRIIIEKAIKKNYDCEVDSYNQLPNIKGGQILLKVFKKTIKKLYYHNVLKQIDLTKYSHILVIKGNELPDDFYRTIQNYEMIKILYLWDSISKYPRQKDIAKYFDYVYTFDLNDAIKYNFRFRPLFYSKNICKTDIKYDACFIGVEHSNRYKFIEQIKKIMNSYNLELYSYIYLTNKMNYFILKYLKKAIPKYSKISDFKYRGLSKEKVDFIYQKSRVIIDLQSADQTGLTMRTIEAIGSDSKLITNNINILNYDFYRKENIMVVDEDNINIPYDFFIKPYVKIGKKIKEKYSIDYWVKELLDDE